MCQERYWMCQCPVAAVTNHYMLSGLTTQLSYSSVVQIRNGLKIKVSAGTHSFLEALRSILFLALSCFQKPPALLVWPLPLPSKPIRADGLLMLQLCPLLSSSSMRKDPGLHWALPRYHPTQDQLADTLNLPLPRSGAYSCSSD